VQQPGEDQVLTYGPVSYCPVTLGQDRICPSIVGNVISTLSAAREKKPKETVNKRMKDEKPKCSGDLVDRITRI